VELRAILRKPYQDVCNVCNVCKGAGSITSESTCPKCKGCRAYFNCDPAAALSPLVDAHARMQGECHI
jgi:RecJ-like exonuclease